MVKNWEVEASFKTKLSEWRTINPEEYSFSINGREPQTGDDMLRLGTYNAIIQPGNEYYDPKYSNFSQSHKTFKRMMPTFAWEVLDVVGAPPVVGIKWRHWGVMKDDYVGFNDKGEKVTAKAHGGPIDLKGTTWAWVDDQVRVKKLETWFDPIEMFRQIAPNGIVNKETVQPDAAGVTAPDTPGSAGQLPAQAADAFASHAEGYSARDTGAANVSQSGKGNGTISGSTTNELSEGSAVAVSSDEKTVQDTHEEMSKITPMQCPFMNGE